MTTSIDRSLINRCNLHLNQQGDKALGVFSVHSLNRRPEYNTTQHVVKIGRFSPSLRSSKKRIENGQRINSM